MGQHGLHAVQIGPLVFGNGIHPDHGAGEAARPGQRGLGAGQIDGLCVGENQQHRGRPQRRRAQRVDEIQRAADVGSPSPHAGMADVIAEGVHVLQRQRVDLLNLLGEEIDLRMVGHLGHGLQKANGEFRELEHGAGHVAEHDDALFAAAAALVADFAQRAARGKPGADGLFEVRHRGAPHGPAARGDLAVDAPRHLIDELIGLGNLLLAEVGDVPAEKIGVAVRAHSALARVLQKHLLLQQAAHEHRADEALVEARRALQVVRIALNVPLELVALLLGHLAVDLPEILPQVDGLSVEAQLLVGHAPLLLGQRFCLSFRLGVLPKLLLGDEVRVEALIEQQHLAAALGQKRPQRQPHGLAIHEARQLQRANRVDQLAQPHLHALIAQRPGEAGQLTE